MQASNEIKKNQLKENNNLYDVLKDLNEAIKKNIVVKNIEKDIKI